MKNSIRDNLKPKSPDDKLKLLLEKRGHRLKQWRVINGYSKVQLAAVVGMHVNTLTAWEAGGIIPKEALNLIINEGWPRAHAILEG